MPCIKEVVNIKCQHCCSRTIKFGKTGNKQRYRCKNCKKIQLAVYKKNAYKASINSDIVAHVKEGCGIRSIARLLHIAAGTVLGRIQKIAGSIKKPAILMEKTYEVDELKTYIKNKTKECWVIYALDKQTKQVVDFKIGGRTGFRRESDERAKRAKATRAPLTGSQHAYRFCFISLVMYI